MQFVVFVGVRDAERERERRTSKVVRERNEAHCSYRRVELDSPQSFGAFEGATKCKHHTITPTRSEVHPSRFFEVENISFLYWVGVKGLISTPDETKVEIKMALFCNVDQVLWGPNQMYLNKTLRFLVLQVHRINKLSRDTKRRRSELLLHSTSSYWIGIRYDRGFIYLFILIWLCSFFFFFVILWKKKRRRR